MYAQPYEMLIFDWDGTLSDSGAAIVVALRAASLDMGYTPPADAELRGIIGLSLEDAAGELFGIAGDEARRFAAAYRVHSGSPQRPGIDLFDGARETLAMLRDAGFMLTVATGKGRAGLDRELERCGLAAMFDLTRCADETRSKPHPQMVLELLTDADCSPQRALVIGDTDYDLMMARAASVDSVAVACGNHPPERLQACAPLALLQNVAQLPSWLGSAAR